MKNGTNRTFTVTRITGRPSACTSSSNSCASRDTSRRISSGSVRSFWKVRSRPCPRATCGASLTSASSSPVPSRRIQGPVFGPNSVAIIASSAAASCSTRRIPNASSFRPVFTPIPQSVVTGWGPMTSSQFDAVRTNTPRGFANPLASFARCFESPTPIEHQSFVRSSTRACTSCASASGSFEVTPMNASSHPSTCTTAGNERSTSITPRDASRYAGASTGRNTASGTRLNAVRSGIAEPTPNRRAT